MTTLEIQTLHLPTADFGEESTLASIAGKLSLGDISNRFHLDEDDGLFLNYGTVESAYPYRSIDGYARELKPCTHKAVVLENDRLRATFMPSFGGKLWSLFDKKKKKELLFSNPVVRPCNLGVRNAWLSGGIEWNGGFKGHNPFTCSLVNTAQAHLADGTPVLRFYYFERIRCAVIQLDFFLPEGSDFLYARVRLTNPNETVLPMYWWSNVAVDYGTDDRVIAPAREAYTAPDGEAVKIKIPVHNGIDVSYPHKNITSNDYFWKLTEKSRPWIAKLDGEGYGLCEASTRRLKGRKLFVWGNSQGGRKWMNFLTSDDKPGTYAEIQCGLAATQYECLPMPPHSVWEFLEAYGPMQANPKAVGGTWEQAQQEVEAVFAQAIPGESLEKLLCDTKEMALSPADKLLFAMEDGWGALELLRRQKTGDSAGLMCSHLDFGSCHESQKLWLALLEEGTVGVHTPDAAPLSYNRQAQWLALLEKAIQEKDRDNWYAHYLLGTAYVAEERYEEGEKLLQKSVELCPSCWGEYALGIVKQKIGDEAEGLSHILKAYALKKGELSLTKELFRRLYENESEENSRLTLSLFEEETEEIQQNKRCQLYYAFALARLGELDRAEELLCGKDKKHFLVVPDIRECELTVTRLWVYINEQRGLTREQMGEPPYDLDFRMFAAREGWF